MAAWCNCIIGFALLTIFGFVCFLLVITWFIWKMAFILIKAYFYICRLIL